MNRRITVAAGAAVLTVSSGLWLFPAESGGPAVKATRHPEFQAPAQSPQATRPEITTQTSGSLPPLPSELAGLEPDGDLRTDDRDNLVPTKQLRTLFDFYLANLDQEPLPQALRRIREALSQRFTEPALGQSISLLQRYVDYRLALDELDQQLAPGVTSDGFDLEALRQREQALEALRLSHFSQEEYTAFFEDDQQLDNYTLARLEIERNGSLSADEKRRQLMSLEQQLSEAQRQARKRATVNGEVYTRAEALKAEGASADELYQLRAASLGDVAAANLAELDEQQRQWQARLSQYAQAKARFTEAGLSPADRAQAIEALRERLFTGREQLRVRALEADGL
ncbi:hypothetical protein MD273_10485 [Marinobacter pelagius]|uniref:lipase secretion chaperone n=1 Tax=Marinobacter sp. C7 TaxID=2951363 RepID=UPI001EF0C411|nr:lipase secretion chaperone [Marinobacter sp. C7]MCG7200148.1 hypothetical protein [Marinobacter sp. C7]